MNDIDLNAQDFLFSLRIIQNHNINKWKGSIEHMSSMDLSQYKVANSSIHKNVSPEGRLNEIFKIINGEKIGLEGIDCDKFLQFVSFLTNNPNFRDRATESFILTESFQWIIGTFIEKTINYQFTNYLLKRIEEETLEYTFHFPILNLHIEEPFFIGNSKFEYFTKEDFKYLMESDKEDKEELFSMFYGKVVVSNKIKLEKGKAKERAFNDACLAMDVFRLFSPALLIPTKIFKVDLEQRININFSSNYFVEFNKGQKILSLHVKTNNEPHYFSNELKKVVLADGLTLFSNFIKVPQNDDFYKLIIYSISFFSYALSNPDLHLRITQLIMIIEGLLFEDGFVKNMQKTSINRLNKLKILDGVITIDDIKSIMEPMYHIRHEITHKGNRLPINEFKLAELQIFILELLKNMIRLNKEIKTKDALVSYIERT